MQINPEEVRYLFLTHAHDDHAGFLEEWMTKHPHTQVIAHQKALDGLRRGQNRFVGGCSTMMAYLFCQLMGNAARGAAMDRITVRALQRIEFRVIQADALQGSENRWHTFWQRPQSMQVGSSATAR